MNKIGIIADDLTGATTTGVLLARSSINTVALLDSEKTIDINPEIQAIVLSTNSRSLPKKLAQDKVNTAFKLLSEHKIVQYSKRIDTTMRGGIGYEVDALLDSLNNNHIAVMVPSMPQSNRILVGGYSIINGVALSNTDVANDVLTPIKDTHVPTLYRKQTDRIVGEIQLATILAGKQALKDVFIHERRQGASVIICDAVSLDDIELIAEVLHDLEWNVVAVDPGPFSNALAKRKLGHDLNQSVESAKQEQEIVIEEQDKKVLMFVGSATAVTKEQINYVNEKAYATSIAINAEELILEATRDKAIEKSVIRILEQMESDKQVVIIDTAVNSKVINLEMFEKTHQLNQGDASKKINQALGDIANLVMEKQSQNIAGLYLTGGDTMVSILNKLHVSGINLIDYVIPQTDLGRLMDGPYAGMPVIGKGGLTGDINTPIAAVKELYKLSKKEK